jgi:rhodanese-related sulfurtransferase
VAKALFILNDPPYGTEGSYNALRLAGSLSKREGEQVKVFLIGDAASCAKKDQKVPQGYYNAENGWLEARQPVTVLDIRTDEDRGQWAIPGSVHVNACDASRAGEATALAEVSLPPDRPVVTVCNAGRVSQAAANLLAQRGLDARSLAGGMKAWSLAWNTAGVPLSTFVERVVSRLPPTPPNFARIVELNEAGEFSTGDPTELEAGANRCAVAWEPAG